MVASSQFGNTPPNDSSIYIERRADRQLMDALSNGRLAYVSAPPGSGVKSLLRQSVPKLRDAGFRVVVIDLTAYGVNVNEEQWFDGMLLSVGRQLDIEDELEEAWIEHRDLSPALFACLTK